AEMGPQSLRAELIACSRDRSPTERLLSHQTGERTGSRPSAAEGGGAPAPALSPADRRSTSSTVALVTKVGSIVQWSRERDCGPWPKRIQAGSDAGWQR